jgi:hypothetical protein
LKNDSPTTTHFAPRPSYSPAKSNNFLSKNEGTNLWFLTTSAIRDISPEAGWTERNYLQGRRLALPSAEWQHSLQLHLNLLNLLHESAELVTAGTTHCSYI